MIWILLLNMGLAPQMLGTFGEKDGCEKFAMEVMRNGSSINITRSPKPITNELLCVPVQPPLAGAGVVLGGGH